MMNLMNRKAVTVVAMVSLAYAATRYNTFAAQALFGSTTCSSRHVDETTVSELKQQIKNSVQMMGASAQTVEITLDDITTAGPFGQNGGKKCDANAMLAITWVHNSQQTFPSKNILPVEYRINPTDNGKEIIEVDTGWGMAAAMLAVGQVVQASRLVQQRPDPAQEAARRKANREAELECEARVARDTETLRRDGIIRDLSATCSHLRPGERK